MHHYNSTQYCNTETVFFQYSSSSRPTSHFRGMEKALYLNINEPSWGYEFHWHCHLCGLHPPRYDTNDLVSRYLRHSNSTLLCQLLLYFLTRVRVAQVRIEVFIQNFSRRLAEIASLAPWTQTHQQQKLTSYNLHLRHDASHLIFYILGSYRLEWITSWSKIFPHYWYFQMPYEQVGIYMV